MNKKKAWLLLAIAALVIITTAITVRRSLKGSNDFDTYYHAGKAVLAHESIYYKGEYYQDRNEAAPFLYAPVIACFFVPFAFLPMGAAAALWNLVNLALAWMCIILSFRLLSIDPHTLTGAFRKSPFPGMLTIAMIAALLIDNVTMAQVNILIFFLILLSIHCVRAEKPMTAGLAFSASVLFKLTPLLFGFFFLARRSWKVIFCAILAMGILTAVLPAAFMGWESSRIAHRQWLGRTVKPVASKFMPKLAESDPHPNKKTAEEIAMIRLEARLVDKNQAFEGALFRLLLKDRNGFAFSSAYPVYPAQKYAKLPVLFGGIERENLFSLLRVFQIVFLTVLLALSVFVFTRTDTGMKSGLIAVYFLSLSLFSPVARSHQFVFWIFPLLTFWKWKTEGRVENFLIPATGCMFYFLQALPYGKAAGLGAFANTVLWLYFIWKTWTLKLPYPAAKHSP